MRRCALAFPALLPLLLLPISIEATPSNRAAMLVTGFSAGHERAVLTLHAGEFTISEGIEGERIEVEQFGMLLTPGKPYLPVKRFLVALPPGARALSVEVLRARTTALPGTHRIEPSPTVLPLTAPDDLDRAMEKMQSEWRANHDAVYRSDAPYPARIAWLDRAGTLRSISYAAVSFAPVTCHPASGRLEFHREVEVAIHYEFPGIAAGDPGSEPLLSRATGKRASRLFCNFDALAANYSMSEQKSAPKSTIHDYVIITTAANVGGVTASDFVSWKTTLGFHPRIVLTTDSEIASQPGGDLAAQIRNFLRSSYLPWEIDYVLLVGSYLAVPMRICYPDPTFHVYNPDDPGLVAPGTPTDHYYADLSFADSLSWDSDGDGFFGEHIDDSPDFLAEIAVGRIPVNNNARITYTLDKIVDFEQDGGVWKNSALHVGSVLFFENQNFSGVPFVDGATLLDSIETALMNGWTTHCMSEQEGMVVSNFPWAPTSEAAFSSEWRDGRYGFVNWSGHGWCNGAARTVWYWDDGDGVPETDGSDGMSSIYFINTASTNLDDDHPSIVFAVSCNVGYPEPNAYGRAGVDLLTDPDWGAAVGIVCSSRPAAVSKDWINDPGGAESISYEFNRFMIAEGERLGDAIFDAKFHSHTEYGWDTTYEPMNMYNFNLYGDPSLLTGDAATGVAEGMPAQNGGGLRLRSVEPNPFTTTTTIHFDAAADLGVTVSVYNIRGRRVAGLAGYGNGAGRFTATWNGRDDAGRSVASGLYFMIVQSDSERLVRKVVLLH